MRTKIIGRLAAGAVPLVLLVACSSGGGAGDVVTVTVPPSGAPTSGAGAGTNAVTSSSSASGSRSATSTELAKLPGTCSSLLPDYRISQALNGTQLVGKDEFIVGEAQKSIGRLAYLNCRYGVTGSGDTENPKIEIGISLYANQAQAADRVRGTVDDYQAHGASAKAAVVAGVNGTLLTGGTGDGYELPLLVATGGRRTVAVSVDESVATGDAIATTSRTLATLALRVTAR